MLGKYRFTYVFILIASLLVCGCSHVTYYDQKDTDDETNLRFCWNWADSGIKSVTLKEIMDSYLKHNSNISIENEYSGDDTFYQKLQIDFASQNAPDIISMRPGNIIYNLMEKERLADLSPLYQSNASLRDMMKHSAVQDLSLNGKLYGLPLEERYILLYVNTDIFKYCEAEIPTNFSELETAIHKIKAKGITPIAYCPSDGNLLYQAIINSLASGKEITSLPNAEISDLYTNGLYELKKLFDLGAFPDSCLTMTAYEQNLLFINKKAAMIVQDSSFPGLINTMQLTDSPNADTESIYTSFQATSYPSAQPLYISGIDLTKGSYIKGLGDATFYASHAAFEDDKKEAAISKLFLHLTDEKNVSLMTRNAKFLPAVTLAPDAEYYNPLITHITLQIMKAYNFSDMPERIVSESVWNSSLTDKIPSFLVGNINAEEITNNILKAY